MLHFDSNAWQFPVRSLLSGGEFPSGRLLLRLVGYYYRWLVPLKSGVFVEDRLRGIANGFIISNLFVMGLADTSVAQEADTVPWLGHDDDVLVAVSLLLSTVV